MKNKTFTIHVGTGVYNIDLKIMQKIFNLIATKHTIRALKLLSELTHEHIIDCKKFIDKYLNYGDIILFNKKGRKLFIEHFPGIIDFTDYTQASKWLENHLDLIMIEIRKEYKNLAKHSAQGMISADYDKCEQYRSLFAKNNIPFHHGAVIYLLSYILPFSKETRYTANGWVRPEYWVVNNYSRFLPFIERVERSIIIENNKNSTKFELKVEAFENKKKIGEYKTSRKDLLGRAIKLFRKVGITIKSIKNLEVKGTQFTSKFIKDIGVGYNVMNSIVLVWADINVINKYLPEITNEIIATTGNNKKEYKIYITRIDK